MIELKIWILAALVSFLLMVTWYSVQRIIKRIDTLISEVRGLTYELIKQSHKIEIIDAKVEKHEKLIDKNIDRINSLESKLK